MVLAQQFQDTNGATNIAKRGIKYRKLVKAKEHPKYFIPKVVVKDMTNIV
jgi:hypothetical protein